MRKGFALIYVMFFVLITTITMLSIASLAMSDLRQARKVYATVGAYQIVDSAIEDASANIHKSLIDVHNRDIYYNVFDNRYYGERHPSNANVDQGDYTYKVTDDAAKTYIEATGFFRGSKVKMKAECNLEGQKCLIYQAGF